MLMVQYQHNQSRCKVVRFMFSFFCQYLVKPFILIRDKDINSSYKINKMSSRQVVRVKKNENLPRDYHLIQHQILITYIRRNV